MPTEPPLAYERSNDLHAPHWGVLRWGLVAWSATVLVRHGSYWLPRRPISGSQDVTAMSLAGVEAAVLLMVLITSARATGSSPTRRTLFTIVALSFAYLAIQAIAFGFEWRYTSPQPTRVLWMLASRVQVWIVPLMAIAAARRASRTA